MGKEAEKKKKGGLPPPMLLSLLVCDCAIIDVRTKKPSIIGVFETVGAVKFPATHPKLTVFFQMTNGRGVVPLTVRVVNVDADEDVIFECTLPYKFADVRKVENFILDIAGITFPSEGEYRFQVLAGDDTLGECRVIVRRVEPPKKEQE